MKKKNLIFLSCILIAVVILSVMFTYYDFLPSDNLIDNQETTTSLSGSGTSDQSSDSAKTVHTPKKIGTIIIIPGEVRDINIENSRKA